MNEGRVSRSFSSCLCIINYLVKKRDNIHGGARQWAILQINHLFLMPVKIINLVLLIEKINNLAFM
jgi:hypothetical protein